VKTSTSSHSHKTQIETWDKRPALADIVTFHDMPALTTSADVARILREAEEGAALLQGLRT